MSKLELIILGVLIACITFLLVIQYNTRQAPVNSDKDIECAFNGTIYYDTVDKKVDTFKCDNGGW